MTDEHIDLGVKSEELYKNAGPLSPMSMSDEKADKVYPTFRYSGPVELELPTEGEMEIKFFKKEETSKVDPKTGKHWYECCIEVRCICKVEEGEEEGPEEPTHRDTGTEDALDALAKALSDRKEAESDDTEGEGY